MPSHLLQKLLAAEPFGVVLVDREARIRLASRRAMDLLRVTEKTAASGRRKLTDWKLFDASGSPLPEPLHPVRQALASGKPVCSPSLSLEIPGGSYLRMTVHIQPLPGRAGTADGALVFFDEVCDQDKAERTLIEQHDRISFLFNKTNEIFLDWDFTTGRNYASPGYYTLRGVEPGAISADLEDLRATIHPDDLPLVDEMLRRSLEGNRDSFLLEFQIRSAASEWIWVQCRGRVVGRNPDGKATRVVGTLVDVSKRKQQERRTSWLASFPEMTPDPVIEIDGGGHFWFLNLAARHAFPNLEEAGFDHPALTFSESENDLLFHDQQIVLTREVQAGDGWFRQIILSLPQSGRIRVYSYDITDRRRAEDALRSSEQKFRSLFENMAEGVIYHDAAGTVTGANPAAARILGLSETELTGRTLFDPRWDFIQEDGSPLPPAEHPVAAALRTGHPVSGKILGMTDPRDQQRRWLSVSAVPQRDKEEAAPQAVFCTFSDMTERMQIEAAKRQSEARFQHLFREMGEGVAIHRLITDPNGRPMDYVILDVNPQCEAIFGVPRSLAIGRRGADVFQTWPPPNLDSYAEAVRRNLPARFEMYQPTMKKYFAVSAIPMEPGHFATVFFDVTERKAAEELLRDSIRDLGALFDTSQYFLGHVDLNSTLQRTCRLAVERFNVRMAWIGLSEDNDPVIRPNASFGDTGGFLSGLSVRMDDNLLAGGPTGMAIRRAEAIIINQIATAPQFLPWRDRALLQGYRSYAAFPLRHAQDVLGSLNVFSAEEDTFTGERLQVLQSLANLAALAIVRSRLSAREQQAAAELESRVAERTSQLETALHELESFSYSVSHDLRAPLRGIEGFTQALLEDNGDRFTAGGREHLERIRASSLRMSRLIDALLSLSRVSRVELDRRTVDLSEMSRAICEDLRQAAPERDAIIEIEGGLEAEGDPRLLQVVLHNLLDNAWKFSSGSTPSRIQVSRTQMEGNVDAFSVRDNGVGFDMIHSDKLFRSFQRLHGQAEFPGTGIGLATVERIIRRHGGTVWGRGTPGAGAEFFFTLPAAPAAVPAPAPEEVTADAGRS